MQLHFRCVEKSFRVPQQHAHTLCEVYKLLASDAIPHAVHLARFQVGSCFTVAVTATALPLPHAFPCQGCTPWRNSPVNHVPVLLQLDHHVIDFNSQTFALPPIVGDAHVQLSLFPVGARFLIKSDDQLRSLTTSLLETVAALHQAGFVHRDIRLDNIVHYFGQWILIDWELTGPVGAPVWWDAREKPPGIQLSSPWTIAADLWQIGCIIQRYIWLDPLCQRTAKGLVDGSLPTAEDALAALSTG